MTGRPGFLRPARGLFGAALSLGLTLGATSAAAAPRQEVPLTVDTVVQGVDGVVWSVAHAPDGRFFYSVRQTGDIFVARLGGLPERLMNLEQACRDCGEGGLMGLALSPAFGEDGLLYAMYTYRGAGTPTGIANKVVRIDTRTGQVEGTVVDEIPGGTTHDGGRLRFGPDGMLYVTTGDGRNSPNLAQDRSSLAGKILRVAPAGGQVEVFSYGHRNPQGLDFRDDGTLFAVEHGPGCRDELNLITEGTNYGWTGNEGCPPPFPEGAAEPVAVFTPTNTIAPSGATFYTGSLIPRWTGSFFFTTLKDQTLYRLQLSADGRTVTSEETLYDQAYGRLRSVTESADGALWLSTDDGRVLRVHPETGEPAAAPQEPDQGPSTLVVGAVIGAVCVLVAGAAVAGRLLLRRRIRRPSARPARR